LFDQSLSGGHDGVMAPTWLPPKGSVGDHLGERGGR
jgi:hypothetical protein